MPAEDVAISGLGLVSPYGDTFDRYWHALMQAESAYKVVAELSDLGKEKAGALQVEFPDNRLSWQERALCLGEKAVKAAIEDRGGLADTSRIALVLGSGLGLSDSLAVLNPNQDDHAVQLSDFGPLLAERIGVAADVTYLSNACSSGAQAIAYGKELLDCNEYDLVICGGLDILSRIAYAGFLRLLAIDPDGCRPFDKNRKGIMVGEGAAFVVLEPLPSALQRKRNIYGIVAGAGVSNDAYHVVQIDPSCESIARAADLALSEANVAKEDIDAVIAHGTGTRLNDKVEALFIKDYFDDHLNNLWVTAPKGVIGHTGGACGAFSLLTAIGMLQKNKIPPVANLTETDQECSIPLMLTPSVVTNVNTILINTFGFGGTNVLIVCKRWQNR